MFEYQHFVCTFSERRGKRWVRRTKTLTAFSLVKCLECTIYASFICHSLVRIKVITRLNHIRLYKGIPPANILHQQDGVL